MDQIALKLYTLKKNVLVFSKPQIFEKQIEMFSSSLDRALLGQRVQKGDQWEWAKHGGRCEEIPLAGAFSCRQGRWGDCVYRCVGACAHRSKPVPTGA